MTIRLSWQHIHNEHESGETFVDFPMNIGRAEDNDLVIGTINDGISRLHVHIKMEDGAPVLQDCGSTNGIYVNRVRVYRMPLTDGMTFLMGIYRFQVSMMVQCQKERCQKMVSSCAKTCPWCGQFMADAVTSFAPVGIGDW